jgi:prepilin-type processing-associated H-X9-DG protein
MPVLATTPQFNAARSRHAGGGVNAAMCDGTVRFYTNNVNINVWRALGTSKGNEPIGQAD